MLWKKKLLSLAEARHACKDGIQWLAEQEDPMCLISDDAIEEGYMEWAMDEYNDLNAASQAIVMRHITPTPAWLERGLTHPDNTIREAWVARTDLELTRAQIERGLTDRYWGVRHTMARRDLKFTKKQWERGMTDDNNEVRLSFATNPNFKPTAAQIASGLMDEGRSLRAIFEAHEASRLRALPKTTEHESDSCS